MIRQVNKAKVRNACLVTAIVALVCAGLLWAGEGNADNPGIMPPDSIPFGMSYGEWQLAWWNWAMSMPAATNPLLNADEPEDQQNAALPVWIGAYDASAGQSGHVWFLAETYRNGWDVVREATIPAGTPLCFPLQNLMAWGWPPIPQAEASVRNSLRQVMDTAVVSCEIDGVPVENLERYRHQSPAVPMVLGEGNLLGRPPGQYGMMVDDGYYLILAPLSVGTHTIHWTATMDLPGTQTLQDVTYYITVVPAKD